MAWEPQVIRIKNVSLAYGKTSILQDISISIPKGGITALIGPNGAGKSSLLGLAARLQPLQTGEIRIDDLSVSSTSGKVLAKKIAILRQDNHVGSRLTVRELVGFGRFPHNWGHLTENDRRIIDGALQLFGLDELAERLLDTLSGGQRQRALVAMAYCQDTDYLLLDEPLNNLDMYFASELMKSLRHVADVWKKTVVIVLHDINYAGSFANRIIAMKDGQVVADGLPHEIMTAPVLRQIYGFEIPVTTVEGKRIALPFQR
jgi:iron complex transport system ATP-binding protein